jgi:hypothetical protein
MRRKVIVLLGALLILQTASLEAKDLRAQVDEEDFLGGDEEEELDEGEIERREKEREDAERKRQEEERKRKEEEARKAEEAKRVAIRKKQQLKERKAEEARMRELDAYREASADTTEYTLTPDSVQLVVEMDPNGYGFRTRAHRMSLSAEIDLILRGRGMLHYDYRFFNYLSVGLLAGIDWTDMSLVARFRDYMSRPAAKQLVLLGGLSAKWRLTEWYMRSSVFLEPAILFGHMWQTLYAQNTTHWRLRPGLFAGVESVFDSGLTTSVRVGVEIPFDFGTPNPIKEGPEPLFLLCFGFAI